MNAGVYFALAGAVLFGASTPIAKALVGEVAPVMLAGILYSGSGVGLGLWLASRRLANPGVQREPFVPGDYKWLAGAVITGGVFGPVLLMAGLAETEASTASLLLNLEGAFTALLAWLAFREHLGRRIVLGMFMIVGGGALLSWRPAGLGLSWSMLAIAGACVCWAIDNNLTRRISVGNPAKIAAIKGLVAGAVNVCASVILGGTFPPPTLLAGAALVGLVGYGISLVFFVIALRNLGAARTSAYFSTAPFIGAALSLALLGDSPDAFFWAAALLMAAGVALHLTERHHHPHSHEALVHTHAHIHDEHHEHRHDFDWNGAEPHIHPHEHEPLSHAHPHFPDIHHRHGH